MNTAVIAEEAHVVLTVFPWIALGVVLVTLVSLPQVALLVRAITPAGDAANVHWTMKQVVLVGLTMILGPIAVSRAFGRPEDAAGLLVASSLTMLVSVALAVHYAWTLDPRRLGALGLRHGNFFSAPTAGVVAYLLLVPGLFALEFVWVWTLGKLGVEAQEQMIVRELRAIEGGERWIAVALGVCVQPFFEELLFRGFLQPVLVQKLRPAAGIAVTSAVFAILHGVTACAPIFGLSCLLGYVMLRTQRLHASWSIHMLHNGLQFLFLYALPEPFQHAAPSGGLVWFFTR